MGQNETKTELTPKQIQFVAFILAGNSPAQSYMAAFQGTQKKDSARSLASREMRKPEVAAAIREELEAQRSDMIEAGLWSFRTSIAYRLQMLRDLEMEKERRREGLQRELEGIEGDEDLTEAQKAQKAGRLMQRPVIGREIIGAQLAVCGALDHLAFALKPGELTWYDRDLDAFNSPEAVALRNAKDAEYETARLSQKASRKAAGKETFLDSIEDYFGFE